MNNKLEIRKITEQVLKDQNLWNLAEIYKKEHNIFRGTHKGFASGGISWDAISGKPSTFTPSSHTHPGTDITSIVAEAENARDHGAAATDMLVNVCYGTGDPPAADTTTIGTLFVKYTP